MSVSTSESIPKSGPDTARDNGPNESLSPAGEVLDIPINESRIMRSIDVRLLPVLCGVFFVQFLDKITLNFANVMGMGSEIGLSQEKFGLLGSIFYTGYLIMDIPQGYLLQAFSVRKVLAINIFLWGVITACTCAVKTPMQLMVLRGILGAFESVVIPALNITTSAFYKKREGTARFGIWFCGVGLGQILGALISYGAQHVRNKFSPWRVMFLAIGLLNLCFSSLVYRMPSHPDECTWLSEPEKRFVLERLKADNSGVGAKYLRKRSITEVICDLQTLLIAAYTLFTMQSAGILVYYSSAIIKGVGFSAKDSLLIIMPTGIITIISTLIITISIAKGYSHTTMMGFVALMMFIGTMLMLFLPGPKSGNIIGLYFMGFAVSAWCLTLCVTGANYRGYTRKIASSVIVNLVYSIANIISPHLFFPREAPHYRSAKVILACCCAMSIIIAVLLQLIYRHRNIRADQLNEPAMSGYEKRALRRAAFGNLDFANRTYRYAL